MDQAQDLHQRDFHYEGDAKNVWERFYDNYDRWTRTGESDRDPLKLNYESISDKHRGVGTLDK